MSLTAFFFWIFVLVLAYKLIDWLIRRPKIGSLSERYVFITGCDHGFGYMLAKRLDERGLFVIAACLTETGETELKKHSSDRLRTVRLDVTKSEDVRRAYEKVKTLLPSGRGLWSIVNNVGVHSGLGPPEWMEMKDYMAVISVNLLGMIDVTTTFLPLVKLANGRIINMSSVLGRFSSSIICNYSISKFGVEAFSDGLRRQLRGTGVSVHIMEPGAHMTPAGAYLVEEQVASAVLERWPEQDAEIRRNKTHLVTKYAKDIARMRETMRDPVYVVDAYEHAVTARFPRARYVVGPDAKAYVLINDLLPEWLGDRLATWVNLNCQQLHLD